VCEKRVGILGATSLVGRCLLPLLKQHKWQIRAFSRRLVPVTTGDDQDIHWIRLHDPANEGIPSCDIRERIEFWICAAPLWVFPDYFPMLEKHGVRRVIALSSTSRFTKMDSSESEEQLVARRLSEAEDKLQAWATDKGISWVILRPTMVYGLGRDKNISEIIRLIRRLNFFPLVGRAGGFRQPVHAEDVAMACLAVLQTTGVVNHAYNLSGAETLHYREMIERLFVAIGRRPRLIPVPLLMFRIAAKLVHCIPRYRNWNAQMAERMSMDLVFDHTDAIRDFNYSPRPFTLTSKDIPL